jgi:ribosome biogenesis protein Nip4
MREFLRLFSIDKLFDESKLRRVGAAWYSVDEDLRAVLKKIRLPVLAAGLCLGQFDGKPRPSPDTLHLLAKDSRTRKAVVNEKGEWMFICRRPVLAESIVKNDAAKGERVLVLNQYGECLGFGIFDGKKVSNEYDIGDFLRRERRA